VGLIQADPTGQIRAGLIQSGPAWPKPIQPEPSSKLDQAHAGHFSQLPTCRFSFLTGVNFLCFKIT
jgi:hypothetical protein